MLSTITIAVTVLILIENRWIFASGIFKIENKEVLGKVMVLNVCTCEILMHVLSVFGQRFSEKLGVLLSRIIP